MAEQLYPRIPKPKPDRGAHNPWRVYYSDLVNEGGDRSSFIRSYRTQWGARLAAYFIMQWRYYGGTAILKHRSEFNVQQSQD